MHVGFIIGFIAISTGLSVLLVKKRREGRVGTDALVTLGAAAAVMAIGSGIMIFDLLRFLGIV